VRILVVEDEAKVAGALKEGLEAEHYEVVLSATGEDGYFRVNTGIEVGAACGQEQLKGRRGMERGRDRVHARGRPGHLRGLDEASGAGRSGTRADSPNLSVDFDLKDSKVRAPETVGIDGSIAEKRDDE